MKDYKRAIEVMEEVKKEQPILETQMDDLKFKTLLKHVSEKEAMAFAELWQKDSKSAPHYVLVHCFFLFCGIVFHVPTFPGLTQIEFQESYAVDFFCIKYQHC